MSLFTIIKYPISDCPTREELAALPKRVYKKWLKAVGFDVNNDMWTQPLYMAEFYNERLECVDTKHDIQVLKDIIKRMR